MPYLAVAAFPISTLLAPNPIRFSWGFHHGSAPMSSDIQDKATRADRYWYFFADAITLIFIFALTLWNRIRLGDTGLQLTNWKEGVIIGIGAGALRVALIGTLANLFPWAVSSRDPHRLRAASIPLWTATFLSGAFAEELWIALCLAAFMATGHSKVTAVLITSLVFGATHWEYRFGALATAMYGSASALLFLWLGSLIPMFLFHFIGNLGSLYFQRR
jgi:membrane protease YdiL (CAAX protease family)